MKTTGKAVSRKWLRWFVGASATALLAIGDAQAVTYKVLHSFCREANCTDGAVPYGELLLDASGDLYGTAARGGDIDAGVLFQLGRDTDTGGWKYKTLYSFCSKPDCNDGAYPVGRLIADVSGSLYGVTYSRALGGGGGGTAFELLRGKDGHRKLKTLYKFCSKTQCVDGSTPAGGVTYRGAQSGVLYDGSSSLYGVTSFGGTPGQGTVFSLAPVEGTSKWSHRIIHNFCTETETCDLTDGAGPSGGLLMDSSGNLFGATIFGGENFDGTLFELSPPRKNKWKETVLYAFCPGVFPCTDGVAPNGVVMDSEGNLFGSTQAGGNNNAGALFRFSATQSQLSVLYSFCSKADCADGRQPFSNLAIDAAGNLFGTTITGGGNDTDENHEGGGVAFLLPAGGNFTVLHSFCAKTDCADGEYPTAGMTPGGSGQLFGTTYAGGKYGKGVLFEISP